MSSAGGGSYMGGGGSRGGYGSGGGGGHSSGGGGIISAAVFSKHTFEERPVDIPFEDMEPQASHKLPVNFAVPNFTYNVDN